MNIVFTGSAVLDGEHVVRALLVEIAQENGHHVQSSVTAGTDLVVTSDPGAKYRKIKKAKQYGIPIVSPNRFLESLS